MFLMLFKENHTIYISMSDYKFTNTTIVKRLAISRITFFSQIYIYFRYLFIFIYYIYITIFILILSLLLFKNN